MPNYDWLQRARVLIIEGYFPPFYPELTYDPERLVHVLRQVNANTVRFGVINYYAYIQTDLFTRHPDLGQRDLLRETLEACHRAGFRVIPYAGLSHYVPSHTFRTEWLQRDLHGRPRKRYHLLLKGSAECWYICSHGPYRQVIPAIVRQIVEGYDIDGFYFDGPMYYRPCYCPHCQRSFAERTGLALPRVEDTLSNVDWDDPLIHAYFQWVEDLDIELMEGLVQLIKSCKDIPVIAHGSNIMHQNFKAPHKRLMPLVDGSLYESGAYYYDRILRALLAGSVGKPLWAYTGVYNWHPRLWEHAQDYVQEGFGLLAAGASPIVSAGNKLLFDERGVPFVRTVFDFQARHEEVLTGLQPVKYAAMPYSQSTGQWYGRNDPEGRYHAGYRAGFTALADAKVQANPVLDTVLESAEVLSQYPVVYLPDTACLSDKELAVLSDYVSAGGGLVATGVASLYDEKGRRRSDFGLAEVLGVHYRGENDLAYDTYIRILQEHAALGSFAKGHVLPQYVRCLIEPREGATVLGETLVYSDVEGPSIVVNQYGKGRVVYSNAPLERLYHMHPTGAVRRFPYDRHPDLRNLLASAVVWAAGRPAPYRAPAGPGIVAMLSAKPGLQVLHLVNMTGPIYEASHTVVDNVTPLQDVPVSLWTGTAPVRRVWLLRSGQEVAGRVTDGYLHLTIPRIHDYEAVCVELA